MATRLTRRRHQVIAARAKDAKFILGRELRYTIERVSPEAAKPEEPVAPQD
ncbi:hypothetical protein [Xanthomonas theicola]|uniref:hypothetical protein n=1 Tax=Xanthomonas theicola TaxID=56464 RepID=UPI00130481ED|nr:hypothetical protein [Xanthomonas theicola]QNH26040.1 hypothetical protein G4Q83_16550 [Xanthomonas theicola]